MHTVINTITGTLFVCLLGACGTSSQDQQVAAQTDTKPVQAAWVVVGEQGQATARVITREHSCPVILQDGIAQAMQLRAPPGSMAQRPVSNLVSAMSSDKPAEFPVLTCEAALNPATLVATVGGRALPLPRKVPLKILVLGDTGCRLKAQGNYFQSCNDPDKWAFTKVAKTAARFAPDLVIHVGDYQYRESPCPGNVSACADSPWGYGWDTWQADFFAPAAPLLAAAPWVMARGNHESCNRAGQGWWRFLDPRALHSGRDCNRAGDDLQGDFSAPYAVPIGAGAQLIVFDSSRAGDKAMEKTDPAYRIYSEQFQLVDRLAARADFSILIDHHPILGFAPARGIAGEALTKPGNVVLQNVLQDIHGPQLFEPGVQLLLAGHVHLFEALTFSGTHPMQLVSGNGGSSPDVELPASLPPQATPYEHATVAQFSSSSQSGFTTLERASEHATEWTVKAWNQNGVLIATCQVSRIQKICN